MAIIKMLLEAMTNVIKDYYNVCDTCPSLPLSFGSSQYFPL